MLLAMMRKERCYNWIEFSLVCRSIWGDDWLPEFVRHAGVSLRTVYRWKARDKVEGPPAVMVSSFLDLRSHGLELPAASPRSASE